MGQVEQGTDVVELRGEAQRGRRPLAEEPDRPSKRPGEVLDTERVGVAGRLERRALGGAGGLAGGDRTLSLVDGDLGEHVLQVGERARDRRAGQRPRQVAVLTVGGTAAGDVQTPIRAWRDRLQTPLRRRGDDDRKGRLGAAIGVARVGAPQSGEPVAGQLDHLEAERPAARHDLPAVREIPRGGGDEDLTGKPAAGRRRGGRDGHGGEEGHLPSG